jgi:hypothetical protein
MFFIRAVAVLVVLALVGPSIAAGACEMACAFTSHHSDAPSTSDAQCHEHQGSTSGVGVSADPAALCHDSGELPSATVDARPNLAVMSVMPATIAVITPTPTHGAIRRAPDCGNSFDPRPPQRPIRV